MKQDTVTKQQDQNRGGCMVMSERLREMAEKIVDHYAPDDEQWDDLKSDIEQALIQVQKETAEDCIQVVSDEEELDGDIPQHVLEAVLRNPQEACKASVRSTKKNIANAIRERYGVKKEPTNETE